MRTPAPKRIAITGAAGQICYSLVFRVAHGEVFGPNQPVILQLLDLPQVLPTVRGVVMEIGGLRVSSYWRVHRYASVAATPSNVRIACSLPHNNSKARDFGPAFDVGIALSLWFVGIMPFASISTAPTIQCHF